MLKQSNRHLHVLPAAPAKRQPPVPSVADFMAPGLWLRLEAAESLDRLRAGGAPRRLARRLCKPVLLRPRRGANDNRD